MENYSCLLTKVPLIEEGLSKVWLAFDIAALFQHISEMAISGSGNQGGFFLVPLVIDWTNNSPGPGSIFVSEDIPAYVSERRQCQTLKALQLYLEVGV